MNLRRLLSRIHSFLAQRREALAFADIPDPRDPRGVRWSLPTLLCTAVFGLLTVARSLRAAEKLSADLAGAARRLGIDRRVPDSTLGDALSRIDPHPLRDHLHAQVRAEHRRKALLPTVVPIGAVSLDGKENGRFDERVHPACQEQTGPDGKPPFAYRVLNATLISAAAAVCIDQMPIAADTNEMATYPSAVEALLHAYGRSDLIELIFCDAGMTSEENARFTHDKQRAYVMAIKGNQPEREREARRVFAALTATEAPEVETPWEVDSSRGRIRRQLFRSAQMAGWGLWSHLRQVWMVRVLKHPGVFDGQERHGPAQVLEERLYGTNLVWGRLRGPDIERLVRAHWRCENNLHGTMDLQWKEDRGLWVRRGNGLPVCGLLRALAYNLLSLLRAVHLRSAAARAATWQQLRDWMRDTLLWMPSLNPPPNPAGEVVPGTP
jgi:hypothetical protein